MQGDRGDPASAPAYQCSLYPRVAEVGVYGRDYRVGCGVGLGPLACLDSLWVMPSPQTAETIPEDTVQ